MDTEILHPKRYCKDGIEMWDVERAFIGQRGFEDHLQASILEYVARFREKNGFQDLQKAGVVLNRLISELESHTNTELDCVKAN